MLAALLAASVLAGAIATAVMVLFLYLPTLWEGAYYDTLGGLGAVFVRRVDGSSRLVGALILGVGGVLFAVFYGAFVLMFMRGPFPAPAYLLFPGAPVEINLFYPLLGLVGGFCHGIFLSLITSFIATDFLPLGEEYRDPFRLILSYVIGHMAYGVVVMFFLHQLLQLLL